MSGPSYTFTGDGDETVHIGWDPDVGTFWAVVHHPPMPDHWVEQGIDPKVWNPRDNPEVLVGASPFEVLQSKILIGRVRQAGYRVPAGIAEDLALYDNSARTLENTVQSVTQSAAWRLDRPGVSPQDHAETQRKLHAAAREAAVQQYHAWDNPEMPALSPEEQRKVSQIVDRVWEERRPLREMRKRLDAAMPPDPHEEELKRAEEEFQRAIDEDNDQRIDPERWWKDFGQEPDWT